MMKPRGTLWMVTRSLPVHQNGGMERVAFDTVSGLARRGWKIDLVTTKLANDPGFPEGVRVYALDARPGRYSGAFTRGLVSWSAARSAPPDAILSISSGANPIVARHREVPAVFQCHGCAWNEMTTKLANLDPRAILRLDAYLRVDRRMMPAYDTIVAVGPAVVGYLHARPYRFLDTSRIIEIPNGIDTDACERAARIDRTVTRAKLGVPPDGRLLFIACRLTPGKGVRTILEAYADMKKKGLVVAIAGSGREERVLHRIVRRRRLAGVRFLGAVDHDTVLETMCASDLVVQAGTGSEGLPLVILEALSTGCPVLVSRRYSLPPFERDDAIFTVDPTDRRAIAAALDRGSRLGAPLADVARAARRQFSLDTMIDRYEGVLEEVIAGGKKKSARR